MNFKPIIVLNKRLFRQNRGRNLAAVTAIALTTLMFTTLFVLSQSMKKNLIEMAFRQTGYDAQISIKHITAEDAEKIAAHPDAAEVGQSMVAGLGMGDALAGRQVEIRWADESYAEHSFAEPTTGKMPEAEQEIALDTIVLDRLGIPHELGQKVTLEWIADFAEEQNRVSEFTLCGFWEGNESSYASFAWVDKEFAQKAAGDAVYEIVNRPAEGIAADHVWTEPTAEEKTGTGEDKETEDMTGDTAISTAAPSSRIAGQYMAQVTLYDDRNMEAMMDHILEDTGLSGLAYSVNLAYDPEMNRMAAQENLSLYLGMILVFAAGFLIIYNIFQISVTKDIQFYGKCKTLGMTARQLKKLIYGQAGMLCLIGIPAGMLSGYLLGAVLVPVFLQGRFASVSASPLIFIGSALFAAATVLISCMRPARMAGKASPMEALRYNDVQGGTSSFNRAGKKASSHAGLSALAWSGLGRNKKRTVTVICSLTLGLTLMSTFYAKNAAFDMEKYLSELTLSDYQIDDATNEDYIRGYNPSGDTLSAALREQVESLEGLEGYGYLYSHEAEISLTEQTIANLQNFYTEEKLKFWGSYDPEGPLALREAIAQKRAASVVYGVDGIVLDAWCGEEHLLDGSYDAAQFTAGGYTLAVASAGEEGEKPGTASVGEEVVIEGNAYTVMAVLDNWNPATEGAREETAVNGTENEFYLNFILPAEVFRENWRENTPRKLFFNVEDACIESAGEMLEAYSLETGVSLPVTSRASMMDQYERETRSFAVMGNMISLVISLVGVLNFVNSMVTSIVSRRKEFAMMQSVGMTKKQLCGLLVREGLDYAFLTLLITYAASALAVGVGVRKMVEGGFTTFRFTLLPLVICTPILLLAAALIPYLCFRNIEKDSLVDRLRTEG